MDANRFFIVVGSAGKRHEGLLEIMLRFPERRVAWRVLAGRSLPIISPLAWFPSRRNRTKAPA